MAPTWCSSLVAAVLVAFGTRVRAACSSNLVVDTFSTWSSNTNALGGYVGGQYTLDHASSAFTNRKTRKSGLTLPADDKSLSGATASGGVLTFTPSASSYFYENVPCQAATTDGYGAITFSVQGPASGSLLLEMQTRANCNATSYSSAYYELANVTNSARSMLLLWRNDNLRG
jgi:hypothetical protein